jgi:hypothetical protein
VFFSAADRPVLPLSFGLGVGRRHAHESGGDAFDATEWRALMRAHAQQSARVQSLATPLRITPQATLDPKAGGRALAKHQTGKKPWE